ncbi:MAG: hypothetical protein NVS1B14_02590 [Vulcanimicrobiaceae bacterium]
MPTSSNFVLDASWRAFAESLPEVVYTARPDGSIEYVSERWHELTGIATDSVLNDAWRQIVHPEEVALTTSAWAQGMRAGTSFALETRARVADGSYRWMRSSARPLRDENGAIVRWVGMVADIDQRRSIEFALRDSERRFQILAEAIPVIVWTADASGWIDWYNQGWYEYTGQTSEEAAGWGWQAAHHPEDFPRVMEAWPHSIATGKPFEMEFRLKGADGEYRWFLTRVRPYCDENGTIVRWYGSNVLIEEQKRALERTARVAETLQDVFLPHKLPDLDGLHFDALYIPAERDALIGGDWYDAFELPDGSVVFSIGDVTGHGLEASVAVGRLRQAIFATAFDLREPAEVLRKVNRLALHQDGTIATAVVGFVSPDRQRVVYANAGHPPPIVVSGEVAEMEPYGGLPLGIQEDLEVPIRTLRVDMHSAVVLYTDGLTEFERNVERTERILLRACECIPAEHDARPAGKISQAVLAGKKPSDDVALLVVTFSDHIKPLEQSDAGIKRWRFHSSDALAARKARQELTHFVRQYVDAETDLFTSELIIGEILANTVEHAPGLVEVTIEWMNGRPVITARDTGPGLTKVAAPQLPTDQFDENGRGLFLIQQLAEEVTIRPLPGFGTEIRATLPTLRRAAANQA